MATVQITSETVDIHFSWPERIAGLVRDVRLPLSAVRQVEVLQHGLSGVHGVRAPGLGLPRTRKIGTWRRPGGPSLVSVRRHQPALVLRLEGQRYQDVVVGADDAAALADRLRLALN